MFNDDQEFDRQFNTVFNTVNRTQKVAAFVIAAGAVVSITVTGLIIWAAVHFITKIW